jgi:hypothetical protein
MKACARLEIVFDFLQSIAKNLLGQPLELVEGPAEQADQFLCST